MGKNSSKVRKKKICAKIAQILRKRFSHFVETLIINKNPFFWDFSFIRTLERISIYINIWSFKACPSLTYNPWFNFYFSKVFNSVDSNPNLFLQNMFYDKYTILENKRNRLKGSEPVLYLERCLKRVIKKVFLYFIYYIKTYNLNYWSISSVFSSVLLTHQFKMK